MSFALQWTSSINNFSLPQNGNSYNSIDLFKHHIFNLHKKLIVDAGWTAVSCSYFDGADYDIKNNLSWSSAEEIKFPLSMSTDSLFTIREKNGVYSPTKHSWITLAKTVGSGPSQKTIYLTIDCRFPAPPHIDNTSIVVDEGLADPVRGTHYTIKNLNIDGSDRYEAPLGSGPLVKKTLNFVTPAGSPSGSFFVYPLEQNLDFFCGTTTTDQIALNSITPALDGTTTEKGKYGQTLSTKLVCFVDLVYHSDAPFSGSVFSRPITNYDPTQDSAFDNKSLYTCWGFDNINQGSSAVSTLQQLDQDYYHFHYDPNTFAFIYQLSNNNHGQQNFTSMIGFVPLSNYHAKDKFPFSTLTINVDPGFDENSLAFNTFNKNKIGLLYHTKSADAVNTIRTLDKNSFMNTFYNPCFRNYNFSDGTSSYRYGNTKRQQDTFVSPVYAPLNPRDSTLIAKDSIGVNIVFNGLTGWTKPNSTTQTISNSTLTASVAANRVASSPTGIETIFAKFGENGSVGDYVNAGEYLVSSSIIPTGSIQTTAIPLYTVVGNKKIANSPNFGDTTFHTVGIKDAIARALIGSQTEAVQYVGTYFDTGSAKTLIDPGNTSYLRDDTGLFTSEIMKNKNIVVGASSFPSSINVGTLLEDTPANVLVSKVISGSGMLSRFGNFKNDYSSQFPDSAIGYDSDPAIGPFLKVFAGYVSSSQAYFYGGAKAKIKSFKTEWVSASAYTNPNHYKAEIVAPAGAGPFGAGNTQSRRFYVLNNNLDSERYAYTGSYWKVTRVSSSFRDEVEFEIAFDDPNKKQEFLSQLKYDSSNNIVNIPDSEYWNPRFYAGPTSAITASFIGDPNDPTAPNIFGMKYTYNYEIPDNVYDMNYWIGPVGMTNDTSSKTLGTKYWAYFRSGSGLNAQNNITEISTSDEAIARWLQLQGTTITHKLPFTYDSSTSNSISVVNDTFDYSTKIIPLIKGTNYRNFIFTITTTAGNSQETVANGKLLYTPVIETPTLDSVRATGTDFPFKVSAASTLATNYNLATRTKDYTRDTGDTLLPYWYEKEILNNIKLSNDAKDAVLNILSSSFGGPASTAALSFAGRMPLARTGATTKIPVYAKIPLSKIYKDFVWIKDPPALAVGNWIQSTAQSRQDKGSLGFSLFKTLNHESKYQNSLVAAGYTYNEDIETIYTGSSLLGILKSGSNLTEVEKTAALTDDKNTSDKTYSELPIFLSSVGNPELKGYVSDIYWGPNSDRITLSNGSLVAGGGNGTTYSKIYWNGWWLPWLADEGPYWG